MDTKFFTNDETGTLYDRFNQTLKHTKHFDILVGYFRSSGFHRLYKEFEKIEKVRILVGLNVDRKIIDALEYVKSSENKNLFSSSDAIKLSLTEKVCEEIEMAEDTKDVEHGILKFIKFIKDEKIEIKAHPSQNIHAKVYIMRHPEDAMDYGRIITGSSNFSENGLVEQSEFNVELKDRPDVEYALEKFEKLWIEGIDISNDYLDIVKNKSSLRDDITPYDLYLKFLYEYFKEEINDDKNLSLSLPEGFMDLEYQRQAVNNVRRILNNYNGAFISDVVGLGKTFITALLLQTYEKEKKLILCPPTLMEAWKEALRDFKVVDWEVESTGMLPKVYSKNFDKYDMIIIDEAHNFRNEMSQQYEYLHAVCKNKKVVLVSATPLNNSIKDIENLLSLFLNMKDSPIPGIRNLTRFFQVMNKRVNTNIKGTEEYIEDVKSASSEIREKILSELMVRRTRTDIKKYFSEDIKKQGLSFPTIEKPQRVLYNFDSKTEGVFNETLELISKLSYSRYKPLTKLKKPLETFLETSQKNATGFMKCLLLKRLESSFEAFKKTISRFILSHNDFVKMIDDGTVYIGNNKVSEWLNNDDFEKIQEKIEQEDLKKYTSEEFKPELKNDILGDVVILQKIEELWKNINIDPKLESFYEYVKNNNFENKKLIIFTESKETAEYIYQKFYKEYGSKVFCCSGGGGILNNTHMGISIAKDYIEASFNPNYKDDKDDTIQILITTDILSEGVNMHKANMLVNYDLPWNPTRILQRVGRINRVGTKHNSVHIFNIFPTSESDKHLGLEDNIISKINAFHSALGEDAKYLSEERESLEQHGILGDKLFKDIENITNESGEEESPRLKYLNIIRKVRDENLDLYERIKFFPRKIRSSQRNHGIQTNSLLTFFRKGVIKRFVFCGDKIGVKELDFNEAVKKIEAKKSETSLKLNEDFYDLIKSNKEYLVEKLNEDAVFEEVKERGGSNIKNIISRLNLELKNPVLTDIEYDLVKNTLKALETSGVSKFTAKKIWTDIKDGKSILRTIEENKKSISIRAKSSKEEAKNEVVLSKFFVGDK